MANLPKYATMDDVARLAGVSKGTVDRVLHNRSDVSEKTRQKVLKVIEEIGYKPNIYASVLSMKKNHRIIAVIPYFQKGDYWELVYEGIMRAEAYGNKINTDIEIIYYNQFDINSFKTACTHTLALRPDGVLIAPIYKEDATVLVESLNRMKAPVVYIDTKLPQTDYLAYYGMPLYESGYLAANLLVGEEKNCQVVNFHIDRGEAPPNDSTRNRMKGFRAYLQENGIEGSIYDCPILPNDFMHNMRLFDNFSREHPRVKHILTLNSRAYMIAEWMELRGVTDKKLLGFDMLARNLDALKRGFITTLVAERTPVQVHMAMSAIMDFLKFGRKPARQDNYVHMDILNRYNVDFYLSGEPAMVNGNGF